MQDRGQEMIELTVRKLNRSRRLEKSSTWKKFDRAKVRFARCDNDDNGVEREVVWQFSRVDFSGQVARGRRRKMRKFYLSLCKIKRGKQELRERNCYTAGKANRPRPLVASLARNLFPRCRRELLWVVKRFTGRTRGKKEARQGESEMRKKP